VSVRRPPSARGAASRGDRVDQKESATPRAYTNCHIWQVAYDDTDLGRVIGTATVNWKYLGATVQFVSPIDGSVSSLSTVQLTPADAQGHLEMVFRGDAPSLKKITLPALPTERDLKAAEGAELTVKRSESEVKAKVGQRAFPDDTVTVQLSVDDDNTLIGHWQYRADPLTERARDGGGRVGRFFLPLPTNETGEFRGTQSGREEWAPLWPEIYYVVPLDDQTRQARWVRLRLPERGNAPPSRHRSQSADPAADERPLGPHRFARAHQDRAEGYFVQRRYIAGDAAQAGRGGRSHDPARVEPNHRGHG